MVVAGVAGDPALRPAGNKAGVGAGGAFLVKAGPVGAGGDLLVDVGGDFGAHERAGATARAGPRPSP